ncbi:hypothetical protein BDV93DRAFT_508713 [Ceratobasidium sp. AG-I]|nr:hypothetical protein BDV93DRAFT_508713 [Ceratobasidium sp. AG-I]
MSTVVCWRVEAESEAGTGPGIDRGVQEGAGHSTQPNPALEGTLYRVVEPPATTSNALRECNEPLELHWGALSTGNGLPETQFKGSGGLLIRRVCSGHHVRQAIGDEWEQGIRRRMCGSSEGCVPADSNDTGCKQRDQRTTEDCSPQNVAESVAGDLCKEPLDADGTGASGEPLHALIGLLYGEIDEGNDRGRSTRFTGRVARRSVRNDSAIRTMG